MSSLGNIILCLLFYSLQPLQHAGRARNNKIAMNIELRSDYMPLKRVPNCKFCFAKRFEYESPGFCCGTGTVKIISHRMPTKIHDLYFENS